MAKQGLTLEQKQTQRLALEQQQLLGLVLEKNDAEMSEFIDNKVSEIQALEKKSDDDADSEYDSTQADDRHDKSSDKDSTITGGDTGTDGDDDTAAWYRYFANNRLWIAYLSFLTLRGLIQTLLYVQQPTPNVKA